MPQHINPEDRIIVALDGDLAKNVYLIHKFGEKISFYKIGYRTLFRIESTIAHLNLVHKKIFLDLKAIDTPDTIYDFVKQAIAARITLLSISVDVIEAAVAARDDYNSKIKILPVVKLTSEPKTAEGFDVFVSYLINRGCDGVIIPPYSINGFKNTPEFKNKLIVCAGIRLPYEESNNHKNPVSPGEAIANGADYLVIGRSFIHSPDPIEKLDEIVADIKKKEELVSPVASCEGH